MSITDFLIQVVGAGAYAVVGYSFFKKEKLQILFMQAVSNIIFGLHYFLLSGITGALCSFLSALMLFAMYIYEKKEKENNKAVILIVLPLLILISIFTYKDVFSLFPIIATAMSAISFISNSETLIRIIGNIVAACWLIYGSICRSYAVVIFETIIIITTTIAIVKNRKKNNNCKNKNDKDS